LRAFAVAILKVLGMALAIGMLFGVAGAALIDGIEKSAGRAGPVVVIGLVCTGLLLGAIAGAAQVIVDAITRNHPPNRG
jgi:NADH:ubiquinone oxidoreductase subunit 5 (subunit L)/multisubunit Na+/H+ antiporter MnhA subunit